MAGMKNTAAIATALFLSSCWSSDVEEAAPVVQTRTVTSSDWDYSRGAGPTAPDPAMFEPDLHGAITVPPDRALVTLQAAVQGDSRGAVVQRVRQVASALRGRASSNEGCEASIWSFGNTEGRGERFTSSATLRMDVDLRGLATPVDRHERIESCLAPLYDLPATFGGLELAVGEPRLTIDDPSAHRARLLERRFAELSAVAATADTPPQFRAARLSCTSSGAVTIEQRSLSGIRLTVDFACAPETTATPMPIALPAPPTTAS